MKQFKQQLIRILREIDNKSYPAYKQLKGSYDMSDFMLIIEHAQGDPFASPSMLSVEVPAAKAGFPKELYDTEEKKVALEDWLLRLFAGEIRKHSFQAKGSGKSGFMGAVMPGPEILKRTGCIIGEDGTVVVRFETGFPANGRRIQSRELEKMLTQFLPEAVSCTLYYDKNKESQFKKVAELAEDQEFIRKELKRRKLVAFVANGAILPRESGVSSRPMKNAVAFESPKSLEITLQLPHKGELKGMGIPQGIMMIVGGGFHGKSTLLKALEVGVYNHITGDGREYVITDDTAVKLRAEDITEMAKIAAQEFAAADEEVTALSLPDFSRSRTWLGKADARDRVKMKVMGKDSISINKETIDLRYVEQLVDTGQLAGLANIVWYIRTHFLSGNMSMREAVDKAEELLKTSGFEKVCAGRVSGNLTIPRRQEIFACLNRWR